MSDDLRERLAWQATISEAAQSQVHALCALARKHGIPEAEIDRAMLDKCPGCPIHTAWQL